MDEITWETILWTVILASFGFGLSVVLGIVSLIARAFEKRRAEIELLNEKRCAEIELLNEKRRAEIELLNEADRDARERDAARPCRFVNHSHFPH